MTTTMGQPDWVRRDVIGRLLAREVAACPEHVRKCPVVIEATLWRAKGDDATDHLGDRLDAEAQHVRLR
jgi:hypothetical protein